ncbi:MAG: LysM peptidoglycan-binding domain-containing protein [Verrucomicrobiota bacterium]
MRLLTALFWALTLAVAPPGHGQEDPNAAEDARAERLQILRAADQLQRLQQSEEQRAAQVAALQQTVSNLEKENADLRRQLKAVEEKVDALQVAQKKQQEALMAEIRKLLARPSAPAPETPAAGPPEEGEWYEHVVEKGQTLSTIAEAFRNAGVQVSVEDIKEANQIEQDNLIRVGQKLYIPKN